MKKYLVYLALLTIGAACRPDGVKESMASDEQVASNQASIVVNKRLITEIPISTVAICQTGDARNCGETVSQLRQQLRKLDPLPVPDYGQEAIINWQQADKAYQQFVSAHKNEPLVPLFQQLYARILLNQYGLAQSNHYNQVVYYLDQMITSHSLDLSTMTQTIDHLKGHMAEAEYNQKLDAIIQIAQQQKEYNAKLTAFWQKQSASARVKTVDGDLRPDFLIGAHKQMINQMEKSNIPVHLNRLQAMRKGTIASSN